LRSGGIRSIKFQVCMSAAWRKTRVTSRFFCRHSQSSFASMSAVMFGCSLLCFQSVISLYATCLIVSILLITFSTTFTSIEAIPFVLAQMFLRSTSAFCQTVVSGRPICPFNSLIVLCSLSLLLYQTFQSSLDRFNQHFRTNVHSEN